MRGRLRERAGKTADPAGIRSAFIRPAENPQKKDQVVETVRKRGIAFVVTDGLRELRSAKAAAMKCSKGLWKKQPAPGKSCRRAIAIGKRERRCFSKSARSDAQGIGRNAGFYRQADSAAFRSIRGNK